MSYSDDDDYGNPGYPGRRAPPPDLNEMASVVGLGLREGDELPRRPRYPNARWGDTAKLNLAAPGNSATLVITPMLDHPTPIGFQLRFSADGVNYSATMPANCGVDVTLIKSFDPKAGAAREVFGIDPGDAQPMCMIIARSLTITMRTAETASQPVYVQAVACLLTALDCDAVVPPPPTTPASYSLTHIFRYAAVAANTYELVANADRATVAIVNQSASDLFVSMHQSIDITPGSEAASIILPGGVFAGTAWDNYTGQIFLKFADDDTDGYALLTEGIFT